MRANSNHNFEVEDVLNKKIRMSREFQRGYFFSFLKLGLGIFSLLVFSVAHSQNPEDSTAVSSFLQQASVARDSGEYTLAFTRLNDALTLAEETADRQGTLRALIEIGLLRLYVDDPIIALESFFRAEKMAKELNDREDLAEVYNNIGATYHIEREFTKAIEYYNRSVDIYKELNEPSEIARAYNNFGVLWQDRDQPLIAIEYHRKSLNIWRELDEEGWLRLINIHLGVCHKLMGNLDSAMHYLTLDRSLHNVQEETRLQSSVYAEIGYVHIEAGRYSLATKSCKEGLRIASEKGFIMNQIQNCKCLYSAFEKQGNNKEALRYYKLYSTFQDSAKNNEKAKAITRVEMSHQFERKQLADSVRRSQEKTLRELKYQEELANERADRNIALGTGVGILLLAGGLWSRLRYVRRAQRTIQKERDRSNELLLNILPSQIAAELKQTGKAKAVRYEQAAILFTDFAGFTNTAADMPASDLVEEINICFTRFDKICEQYQIEKIKTIGDAYMAAGGLPLPKPDCAADVVKAALDMQQFMRERAQERQRNNLPAFQMRAGIHVGPVVAGIVGVKKFQYDIWGDTVNTASRMESSGHIGKVNVSQKTYQLIRHEPGLTFQARGYISTKGKGQMEMWFVERTEV